MLNLKADVSHVLITYTELLASAHGWNIWPFHKEGLRYDGSQPHLFVGTPSSGIIMVRGSGRDESLTKVPFGHSIKFLKSGEVQCM